VGLVKFSLVSQAWWVVDVAPLVHAVVEEQAATLAQLIDTFQGLDHDSVHQRHALSRGGDDERQRLARLAKHHIEMGSTCSGISHWKYPT
jgi:hypothetical protein